MSSPYLTKYEIARIVGIRASQIAGGSKPRIEVKKTNDQFDPLEVAIKELLAGKCPLIVKRTLPNGEIIERRCDNVEAVSHFDFA